MEFVVLENYKTRRILTKDGTVIKMRKQQQTLNNKRPKHDEEMIYSVRNHDM